MYTCTYVIKPDSEINVLFTMGGVMPYSSPVKTIRIIQGSKWGFQLDEMLQTNNKNLLIEIQARVMKHFLLLIGISCLRL